MTEQVRLTALVRGDVQGVGFRWWTRSRALELGLLGSATNIGATSTESGRVEVVAQGARADCEALLVLLAGPARLGRPGDVTGVTAHWDAPRPGLAGFVEA